MCSTNSLPLLPGYVFDKKIGHEKWHKSSQLNWINGKVPYLVEAKRPAVATGYPFPWNPPPGQYASMYPSKPHSELPSWIIHDKEVLSFSAYFYDSTWDASSRGQQVRMVKINYFLEDGTLQVNEEKMDNSGISQGTVLSRQRVPFPEPMDRAYHEEIDFNIGKNVELFGRTFYIINCDKFTRNWLNRAGIAVPDPIEPPEDAYVKAEQKRRDALAGRHPSFRPPDNLGKFLKFDRHVLRFYGFWDDREAEGGDLHYLTLLYYLSDDTMEVRENQRGVLISRRKFPRTWTGCELPGSTSKMSLLNVVAGRVAADCLNTGATPADYYKDSDLNLGVVLNIYGRAFKLTDCDAFTKQFYRVKYGLENFGENREPCPVKDDFRGSRAPTRDLPPWNGIGGFDDSAANCKSLVPKAPRPKSRQLSTYGSEVDSYILRFRGRLISSNEVDQTRCFTIAFHLDNDCTSIFETAARNSGLGSNMLFSRREALKPCKDLFVSHKPEIYTKEDFWVGNVLEIDKCKYELIEADEYALRYMELNSQEFPKSNIDLILVKIRSKLKPIYKSFICTHILPDGDGDLIPQSRLANALRTLLADEITPQEIITVTRHFSTDSASERHSKETVRNISQNECRRFLFIGQDRLGENLRHKDIKGTGHVPKNVAYRLCRGAKAPVDTTLLNVILEKVDKNEVGDVNIDDFLRFFDTRGAPTPSVPICQAQEFSVLPQPPLIPRSAAPISVSYLLERLGLEDELKKES